MAEGFLSRWHALLADGDRVEVEPDHGTYMPVAAAAELLGRSTQRIYAMHRRGELASIGQTATELKAARAGAGWAPGESGWPAQVFILTADVERLAQERAA